MPEEEIRNQKIENRKKQETKDQENEVDHLEVVKTDYLESLLSENKSWSEKIGDQQIKTIYIGGGTPFQLGVGRLFDLIDSILETRDCTYLEELSIELNPDPFDEVLEFVQEAQRKYKDIFRLRFSFGIQSFDDQILQSSGRNYAYNNLVHRFRELTEIKAQNTCYNLDFIAFGSRGGPHPQPLSQREKGAHPPREDWLPWDQVRRDFFAKLVKSHIFDGFSVYTLELFPGAERYYAARKIENKKQKVENSGAILSDDKTIWKEFQYIKKVVMDAGYHRYEISNFALSGKRSLHNMVYWTGGEYLGLGINASGMLKSPPLAFSQTPTPSRIHGTPYQGTTKNKDLDKQIEDQDIVTYRRKNTQQRKQYLGGEWLDETSIIGLDEKEWKSEQVMLLLRTDLGIEVEKYRDVLVDTIDDVITDLVESKHLVFDPEKGIVKLRSKGLDVYNSVLMEMLEEM